MSTPTLDQLSEQKKQLLAQMLRKKKQQSSQTDSIPKRPDHLQKLPLSYAQQRLWVLVQMEPDNPFYNVPGAIEIIGQLNINALENAFRRLIERHEILRTHIVEEEGQAYQLVRKPNESIFELESVDLSHLSEETRQDALAFECKRQACRIFDLKNDLLISAMLVRLESERHQLIVNLHHIIADGWSQNVLIRELTFFYHQETSNGETSLPSLPVQYGDYAVWQRTWLAEDVVAKETHYWREQLKGCSNLLELPSDHVRPGVQRYVGTLKTFAIDEGSYQGIKALCQKTDTTLFMVLLSAYYVLLNRYSNQTDINIGAPIANRTRSELEGIIGFFVNTLILRINASDDDSFETLLNRVKQISLDAYSHQNLPFEKIVEEVNPPRSLQYTPLIQAEFILQNVPTSDFKLDDLILNQVPIDTGTTKFDITLELTDTDGQLTAGVRYNTDLFDSETIDRFIEHYQSILKSVILDASQAIRKIPLISDDEKNTLINTFNSKRIDRGDDFTILSGFEQQVSQTPHLPAIKFEETTLSYQELDDRASALAITLIKKGAIPGDIVCINVERSIEMMVALFAVFKTGTAYLPIDPHLPTDRKQTILEDAKVRFVLTQECYIDSVNEAATVDVINLDDQSLWSTIGSDEFLLSKNSLPGIGPSDPIYVIYTSGSTGKPKGVLVPHSGVANRLLWMLENHDLDTDDSVLQKTPITFDVSVWELFWPLLVGARLVISKPEGHKDSEYLIDIIRNESITNIHFVPSMLQLLLDENELSACNSLKKVFCSGEALPVSVVQQLFKRLPQTELHNLYGPTETSIEVSYWQCQPDITDVVPIGYPLTNVSLYVLDEFYNPQPIGVPGELHIGGVCLAYGYLARGGLSADRFVPNPFSTVPGDRMYRTGDLARMTAGGYVEYLGRIDHQVKIRGFRVELGEIETTLKENETVFETIALAHGEGAQQQLIGYVSPKFTTDDYQTHYLAQLNHWQLIFDNTYEADDRIEGNVNIAGWNSSYSGEPLPANEMEAWVDNIVNKIAAFESANILELGCGTGLLLFKLVESCQKYTGWDISQKSLDFIEANLSSVGSLAKRVDLDKRPAHDIKKVAAGEYDCIVLNSVIQYFPHVNYLIELIDEASRILASGGVLFIGDVRNDTLRKVFHTSIQCFQNSPDDTLEKIERLVDKQLIEDAELNVAPAFFNCLPELFESISAIYIEPKPDYFTNELSKYRYDVSIHFNKPVDEVNIDWLDEVAAPQQAAEYLAAHAPKAIGIRNVANARLFHDVKLVEKVFKKQGKSVNDIEQQIANEKNSAQEIADWKALETQVPYNVLISWAADYHDGAFDVILYNGMGQNSIPVFSAGRSEKTSAVSSDKQTLLNGLFDHANLPLYSELSKQLVTDLRKQLENTLPDYMVPNRILCLPRLPLMANGKVDRRSLLEYLNLRTNVSTSFKQAETDIEIALANIWCDVLRVSQIGVNDNFFDMGGHSLMAIQVLSRIKESLSVDLPLRTLFANPTILQFSKYIEMHGHRSGANKNPLVAQPRNEKIPLSYAQQRLWFLQRLEPDSAFYNMISAVDLEGELNVEYLELAFLRIIERHEVLRSTFVEVDGQVCQQVSADPIFNLAKHDISHLGSAEKEKRLQLYSKEQMEFVFQLDALPLFNLRLIKTSENQWRLLFAIHHIISDAWSMAVLIKDLGVYYRALVENDSDESPSLPVQYADYSLWQRDWLSGEVLKSEVDYWVDRLQSSSGVLDLPTDFPRPAVQSYKGDSVSFQLSKELQASLNKLATSQDVTLFMLLLSAFYLLLNRYSGQSDINIGTPVAGRTHVELEDLIGFFVNTLVLRINAEDDTTFDDLLRHVKATSLEDFSHQYLPFELIVDELDLDRELSRNALFQVMFVLQNAPVEPIYLPGVWAKPIDNENFDNGTAKFDLMLAMEETDDGIHGAIQYNSDLFSRDTAMRMAAHLQNLLNEVVRHPRQTIRAINMLDNLERRQLETGFNNSSTRSILEDEDTLAHRFDSIAEKYPDAIAVSDENRQISYSDLFKNSNFLAHYLVSLGVVPESRVGICLDRSINWPLAILAVLKSGACYVPLDPNYPAARLNYLIADANVDFIITTKDLTAKLAETNASMNQVLIDELPEASHDEYLSAPKVLIHPSNLAYIIYTSGSTGNPKGVCVTQANVLRLLDVTSQFEFNHRDVWSGFHSFAFDFSVWEMWGALLFGGHFVVVPYWVSRTPERFVELLQEKGVTILNQTPSAFYSLLELQHFTQVVSSLDLRCIVFGGEALSIERLKDWFNVAGNHAIKLVNMYGITETTVHVTYSEIHNAEQKNANVGRPLSDLRSYILDSYGDVVPIGVVGELYIGGDGLSRGYWQRPGLSAERFIPDAFAVNPGARLYKTGDLAKYNQDGDIVYIGRSDNQVQLRGFRIELAEIEAVIRELPDISDTAVLVKDVDQEDKRLVAYVVTGPNYEGNVSEIKVALNERLPAHMVPQHFVRLSKLPLTINGKLDHKALPDFGEEIITDGAHVEPRDDVEHQLATLFESVLQHKPIGVFDNFFNIGGHSITATRLLSLIEEKFSINLSLKNIFLSPTVAELADLIKVSDLKAIPPIVAIDQQEVYPVSRAQMRLLLTEQTNPKAYIQSYLMDINGPLNVDALEIALNKLIGRHEILRTTYHVVAGDMVQKVHASLPLVFVHETLDDESLLDQYANEVLNKELNNPFKLESEASLRASLVQASPRVSKLCLTLHHIAVDGWSFITLMNDMTAYYNAACDQVEPQLEPIHLHYKDFAVWQNKMLAEGYFEKSKQFQLEEFGGEVSEVDFPTDKTRPEKFTHKGDMIHFEWDETIARGIYGVSQKYQLTPFMVFLSLIYLFIYKQTKQTDLVVGTATAGRHYKAVENIMGFTVNTLPIKMNLNASDTYNDFLLAIKDKVIKSFDAQDYPFDKLIEDIGLKRDPSRSPLFDIMLIVQNIEAEYIAETQLAKGLDVVVHKQEVDRSLFDMKFEFVPREKEVLGSIEFNVDLFEKETIVCFAKELKELAESICNNESIVLRDAVNSSGSTSSLDDFELNF